mmetsp:Transcript_20283/g.47546  ORF Transcript_20283/g.47546 Transcript_20283/m.47546 type:complete len:211 (+) Transcript_20283:1148-1780(+)
MHSCFHHWKHQCEPRQCPRQLELDLQHLQTGAVGRKRAVGFDQGLVVLALRPSFPPADFFRGLLLLLAIVYLLEAFLESIRLFLLPVGDLFGPWSCVRCRSASVFGSGLLGFLSKDSPTAALLGFHWGRALFWIDSLLFATLDTLGFFLLLLLHLGFDNVRRLIPIPVAVAIIGVRVGVGFACAAKVAVPNRIFPTIRHRSTTCAVSGDC